MKNGWLKKLFFMTLALCLATPVHAAMRTVNYYFDDNEEGTIRAALRDACNDAGDDHIVFSDENMELGDVIVNNIKKPLVIPEDCNGSIVIEGHVTFDTLIDGSQLGKNDSAPEEVACALYIYSSSHTILGISFVGNKHGAAVCLLGSRNTIKNNRFGQTRTGELRPNKTGIVASNAYAFKSDALTGNDNIVESNQIGPNLTNGLSIQADGVHVKNNDINGNGLHGIWIKGNDNQVQDNDITHNGSCTDNPYPDDDPSLCDTRHGSMPELMNGWGVALDEISSGNIITDNIIQFNGTGGIVLLGDADSEGNLLSPNINSLNDGIAIDIGEDGTSRNDPSDADLGPNTKLNYYEALVSIPLTGQARYWIWGWTHSGDEAHVYRIADAEAARHLTHGSGDQLLDMLPVDLEKGWFEMVIEPRQVKTPAYLTGVILDDVSSTSEFGKNLIVAPDKDADGVPDSIESPIGRISRYRVDKADTDGDGLPDGVEDANLNGIWDRDLGETSVYLTDSDEDGASDWAETQGDGIYDRGVDADPLSSDSDGDGLMDGQEDKNSNGIWEAYLGETSPLLADSDGDGANDAQDTCPSVDNPQQEPWYCGGER